jgi:hypothetical protein
MSEHTLIALFQMAWIIGPLGLLAFIQWVVLKLKRYFNPEQDNQKAYDHEYTDQ